MNGESCRSVFDQCCFVLLFYTGESSCEAKTEADSSDHTEHSHDDKPRPYFRTRKNSLKQRKAGGDWYSCTQCDKCYSSQSALCCHMNIHTGKYKCTECGRCCGSRNDLADHRRRHSGENPFVCALCWKRFTTSYELVMHSRNHTGDKPYKCQLCDKSYNQSKNLRKHTRIHTELLECRGYGQCDQLHKHVTGVHARDKRYRCYICDAACSRPIDLKVHMRIHTGEKPYTCSLCSKSFSQSGTLQRHRLSVHNSATDELKQDENV